MDSKAKETQRQLKASLAQLRKLGLYNPKNARKKPTRYAKSLIKKYNDVLKGKADVVKVPSMKLAEPLKGQFRVKRGAHNEARVIVPKVKGMTTSFSKKEGTIIRKIGNYKLTPYPDKNVLLRGEIPKLKKGERIAVRIGNNYKTFEDEEELRRKLAEYNPAETTLWQFPYIIKRR